MLEQNDLPPEALAISSMFRSFLDKKIIIPAEEILGRNLTSEQRIEVESLLTLAREAQIVMDKMILREPLDEFDRQVVDVMRLYGKGQT